MSSAVIDEQAGRSERVGYGRLPIAALAAIAGAVLGNLLLRVIAVGLLHPDPAFLPLQWSPPIFFSVVGVLGATAVYALIGRLWRRPVTLFKRVALVVLALSMIPNLLLIIDGSSIPGSTLPNVIVLMLMHVVAWLASVQALTRLAGDRA
jgi:hypothetical protein